MRRLAVILLLPIFSAALVTTAGARTATTPNPCKLVTATDVKAVLGVSVGRGKLQPLGLYESCTYTTTKFVTVTIQTRPLTKPDFVKSAKANPKPVKAISGLGAPAYYVARATLLVWRRGNEATFSIFGAGSALTREIELAKRALRRM